MQPGPGGRRNNDMIRAIPKTPLRRQRQQPRLPQWRRETRRDTRGVQTDRRLWPGEEPDEELPRNDEAHQRCQLQLDQKRVPPRRLVFFTLKFAASCSPRRQ